MTTRHVLVGTRSGLKDVSMDGPVRLAGRTVTAVAPSDDETWVVTDERDIWRLEADERHIATLGEGRANCLLVAGEVTLVGASEARLHRLDDGEMEAVASFDAAPGRGSWYTPWRGPPDVRSIARDAAGTLYVNVHVGGVLRSVDDGTSWEATMDIDADVHQVVAHPSRSGRACVASARGLGETNDGAATWRFVTDGLRAPYCRAVAVSDRAVLVSASVGPSGGRAALYRKAIDGEGALERCTNGLPEWFTTNVDTFCLAALGSLVVAGDASGTVYLSEDDGDTWDVAAQGLPGVTCVAIT